MPDHAESWEELTGRVREQSTPSGAFFLMVTLSTTIAAYGLLSNSTAVVIGAMLVAPLMGPIFGIALGLAAGDTTLLGRAVGAELKGMALSVGLALAIGLVPNHPEFGSEILGRTHPTVYDVVVAVASGLAGAFALGDRRVSPALPGVAIATAIVPPLATVGLCLSAGRVDLAGGAFLLFLANLLAIEAAAAAYFTWVGVRRGHLHAHVRMREFVTHFGVSVALLVAVGVFLTRTLLTGITRDRRRDEVRHTLGEELRMTQGARLTDLTLDEEDDSLNVFAVVMTPQAATPPQIAEMEAAVGAVVHMPVRLVVRSLISRDADRDGPVYVAQDLEADARRAEAEAQTRMLTRAGAVIRTRLSVMPGVELEELRRERRARPAPVLARADSALVDLAGSPAAGDSVARAAPARPRVDTIDVLTAVVRTPVAIAPAQVDSLDAALDLALGTPIRLVVRSVLTRDADAAGFLYERATADTADTTLPAAPRGHAAARRRP